MANKATIKRKLRRARSAAAKSEQVAQRFNDGYRAVIDNDLVQVYSIVQSENLWLLTNPISDIKGLLRCAKVGRIIIERYCDVQIDEISDPVMSARNDSELIREYYGDAFADGVASALRDVVNNSKTIIRSRMPHLKDDGLEIFVNSLHFYVSYVRLITLGLN